MSKQYNTKLQERLEKFLKDENLSQASVIGMSFVRGLKCSRIT